MYSSENPEEYQDRNTFLVGARLGWLDRSGCKLSEHALTIISELKGHKQLEAIVGGNRGP